MHAKSHVSNQIHIFKDKRKGISPMRRQYQVQYKVIEKNISTALSTKTIHTVKPKNILLTSQHSPLKPRIAYQFIPTVESRQSTLVDNSSTLGKCKIKEAGRPRSGQTRCLSAFSRIQRLKNTSLQRKAEKVLNSLGMILQERSGRKGEKLQALNLLRIHGSSEKRIQINNFLP